MASWIFVSCQNCYASRETTLEIGTSLKNSYSGFLKELNWLRNLMAPKLVLRYPIRVKMLESSTKPSHGSKKAMKRNLRKFWKLLKSFTLPQRNLLYKRHGFWQLSQQEGESVDGYETRFKLKVEYCKYDKTCWLAEVRAECCMISLFLV